MFIVESFWVDPLMLALAVEQNSARASPIPGAEKTSFAWVPLSDLLSCTAQERKSYILTCQRRVTTSGSGQRRAGQRFVLRPCFAARLVICLYRVYISYMSQVRGQQPGVHPTTAR